MALISLDNKEISPMIDLVESFVPGLDLTPIKNIVTGLDFEGELTITKNLDDGQKIGLDIQIKNEVE